MTKHNMFKNVHRTSNKWTEIQKQQTYRSFCKLGKTATKNSDHRRTGPRLDICINQGLHGILLTHLNSHLPTPKFHHRKDQTAKKIERLNMNLHIIAYVICQTYLKHIHVHALCFLMFSCEVFQTSQKKGTLRPVSIFRAWGHSWNHKPQENRWKTTLPTYSVRKSKLPATGWHHAGHRNLCLLWLLARNAAYPPCKNQLEFAQVTWKK